MARYNIKVYRSNPAVVATTQYDAYTFEFDYQPTALEVLRKIRDEADQSIAFRESCGLGKCGSCALTVNKQPVLACRTLLSPGEVVIEPLAGHEIIKDLVVERSEFHDRLIAMRVFHNRPDHLRAETQPIQWDQSFQELNRCIGCLICESICPSFTNNPAEFPGPALLVQLSRAMQTPLSKGSEAQIAWIDGIHNCTACMNCTKFCPKDIDPFRNALLPLRNAISDNRLELPNMQEGLAQQYRETGRIVAPKPEKAKRATPAPDTDTVLFLGCMLGDRYEAEGNAIVNLLAVTGTNARIATEMVCCGGPLLWVGKSREAKEAFKKNLDLLIASNVKRLITPCVGCSLTFKKDYSLYYRQKTGRELPFEVIDLTAMMDNLLREGDLKTDRPLRAVYHRPCHAGTGHQQLETALMAGKVGGLEIVAATDRCCGGMAGSSNSTLTFELSANIITQAEKEGADILVTACIFCRDNLHRSARRKRSKLKVENSLLFLARQIGTK